MRRHCWIVQLHFKFENHQIQFAHAIMNLLMQGLLLSFLSCEKLQDFTCSCSKLFEKNTLFYLFQKQKYLKNLARSKLFNHLIFENCWILQFHFKFKNHLMKDRHWFIRNSFGSSFVNWEVTRPHKFLIKVI